MAYIWSYLRRYPKWLAMNFTAAILFVIANLGSADGSCQND